ncbi:MAG: hypothetical protein GF411_08625 [Candidatus Lokiarchaeota archaeon]|nr:hypothetical protein [Candidatus Lokiarchaeota archaeon]
MRRQLKEAAGFISKGKEALLKVSFDKKIPEPIRAKASKIADALEIDLEELGRMREYK